MLFGFVVVVYLFVVVVGLFDTGGVRCCRCCSVVYTGIGLGCIDD